MMLPSIGEIITTERARALCLRFGLVAVVARIDEDPTLYREWVFDGASCVPDEQVAELFNIPHLTEISLRHDLKYAYGEPDNDGERLRADEEFRQDLLNGGAPTWLAHLMFSAVRLGGDGPIKTSFTWGFARKT